MGCLSSSERGRHKGHESTDAETQFGDKAFREGDFEVALSHYSRAMLKSPSDVSLLLRRAEVFRRIREFHQCLADLDSFHQRQKEIPSDSTQSGSTKSPKSASKAFSKASSKATSQQDLQLDEAERLKEMEIEASVIRADCYLDMTDYSRALLCYSDAIAKRADDAELFAHRGICYFYMKRLDEALSDYTKSIDISNTNPIVFANRARCYFEMEQFTNAIEDYTKAIELNPSYLIGFYMRGRALMAAEELQKALSDFTQFLASDPKCAAAYLQRGRVYDRLHERDHALEDFNACIEADANMSVAYFERGGIHWKGKNTNAALSDFKTAISLDPTNSNLYLHRARIYMSNKDYAQAIVDFTEAFNLDKQLHGAILERAIAHASLGRLADAIADIDCSLKIKESPNALAERARILIKMQKFVEAKLDLQKCIEDGYKEPIVYVDLGRAFACLEQWNEAIDNFTIAIGIDNGFISAFIERGSTYYSMGELDKAINDISKAIFLSPNNAIAYHNRGCCYFDKMMYAESIKDQITALRLDPKFVAAHSEKGAALLENGQSQEALVAIQESLSLQPGRMETILMRGRCQLQLGNLTAASDDFKQVETSGQPIPSLHFYKGLLFLQSGQTNAAVDEFTLSIQKKAHLSTSLILRAQANAMRGDFEDATSDLFAVMLGDGSNFSKKDFTFDQFEALSEKYLEENTKNIPPLTLKMQRAGLSEAIQLLRFANSYVSEEQDDNAHVIDDDQQIEQDAANETHTEGEQLVQTAMDSPAHELVQNPSSTNDEVHIEDAGSFAPIPDDNPIQVDQHPEISVESPNSNQDLGAGASLNGEHVQEGTRTQDEKVSDKVASPPNKAKEGKKKSNMQDKLREMDEEDIVRLKSFIKSEIETFEAKYEKEHGKLTNEEKRHIPELKTLYVKYKAVKTEITRREAS